MPSGKYITKDMKAEILRLREQGLTYKVIAARIGLRANTISKVLRRGKENP